MGVRCGRGSSVDLADFREYSRTSPTTRRSASVAYLPAGTLMECANRVNDLEDVLAECEAELEALATGLGNGPERRPGARLSRGSRGADADDPTSPESPGSALKSSDLETWRRDCTTLTKKLQDLAADALECSCDRGMIDAMEVFEEANSALDQISTLLRQCKHAEIEASAPESCDAAEWRIVAFAIPDHELAALRELVASVEDCDEPLRGRPLTKQPQTLLRFLRAKDGNVAEAARMLRSSMQWRQTYDIEERSMSWCMEAVAGSWRSDLVERYGIHRVLGTDRFGLPVYLFRWCVFDVAGAERELGLDLVLQIMLSIHEQLHAALRGAMLKSQALPPGALYVWDIGNYGRQGIPGWWQRMLALVRFLPKVASLLEENYPEVIRKIMVVRAGPASRALYNTAVRLIPSKTVHKCRLFGWNASAWRDELASEMPGTILPAFLTEDSEEAIGAAEPQGGYYPAGAAAEAQRCHAAQDSFRSSSTARSASRRKVKHPCTMGRIVTPRGETSPSDEAQWSVSEMPRGRNASPFPSLSQTEVIRRGRS